MGLPGTWSPSPTQGCGCFNLGLSVYIPWVTTVARAVILKPKGEEKKSNLNLKSSRVRNLSDRSAQSCYSFPGSFLFFLGGSNKIATQLNIHTSVVVSTPASSVTKQANKRKTLALSTSDYITRSSGGKTNMNMEALFINRLMVCVYIHI